MNLFEKKIGTLARAARASGLDAGIASGALSRAAAKAGTTMRPYAFATGEDGVEEITLYGDIVERRPVDWLTGEPIEGSFIILSEFLAELKKIEKSSKTRIRIHSVGGNAYDALTIHNRLKELAGKGMEIEVVVDGVAMSGGSIIMCAGDVVKVFPGSIVMIHRGWSFLLGGYSAPELRKTATWLDSVDKAQTAIYNVKAGIAQDELMAMLEAETYMIGQDAIDKGFADELVEGTGLEIAASADRKTLFVSGTPVWVSCREGGIPQHINIPVFSAAGAIPTPAAGININVPAQAGGTEGGTLMSKTLEELMKEDPELANALMAEARTAVSAEIVDGAKASEDVENERKRIKAIDDVAALFDDETVQAAKYGDNPCTAQEMTYRAAQKAAKEGKNFMAALKEDAEASGAKGVGAAPGKEESGPDTPDDVKAAGKRAAEMWKEAKGGKKDE